MKIGFDAKRATLNFRGLGNYSRTLISGLVNYYPEHEYQLFSPHFNPDRILFWQETLKQCRVVTPTKNWGKAFDSVWRSLFLSQFINQKKLDLYHGLSHELPRGIDSSVRTFVTIHDLIFLRYPQYFSFIDRAVFYQKFKYSIERADVVLAICEQTKNDILHFFPGTKPEKIHIHYQAVHPSFEAEKNPIMLESIANKYALPADFILNVGAFETRKNQLHLIEAFAREASSHQHHLILVGRGGAYLKSCQQKVSDLKISDRVSFLDQVTADELPYLYHQCSFVAFPSIFEGFGLPIVEAHMSGKPVISSTGSCFHESGGDGAIYVDPYDVEGLSREILNLILNQDLYQNLKSNGLRHVQKFTSKASTQNLMSLYRS